jgi:putative transposase
MPNQFTCYRWRKEFGGLKTDQVKRLKELESEASNATGSREMPNNERLGKAVSDLTLEKLILREAALGNFVRHCA